MSTTSSQSTLMINHQPLFDQLASCIKKMPTAYVVVDAMLSAGDMFIAGPFMIFVFTGYK